MKKIISMILVFVMILSFMPIGALPAYAENEENSIQEIDQEVVNDTTPVENTNDQNLETNLGQTEGQELGEQTPGQEISEELDNVRNAITFTASSKTPFGLTKQIQDHSRKWVTVF